MDIAVLGKDQKVSLEERHRRVVVVVDDDRGRGNRLTELERVEVEAEDDDDGCDMQDQSLKLNLRYLMGKRDKVDLEWDAEESCHCSTENRRDDVLLRLLLLHRRHDG